MSDIAKVITVIGNHPESFAKAAEKAGPIEIPGAGKVTYDKKTHTFEQPVYIFRFDPATKTTVRDDQPSA